MGHKNNQGQDYSELSRAKLELEYLRAEPFLTVYGEIEESLEVKQDVRKLESRIVDLNREVQARNQEIEKLKSAMKKIEPLVKFVNSFDNAEDLGRALLNMEKIAGALEELKEEALTNGAEALKKQVEKLKAEDKKKHSWSLSLL